MATAMRERALEEVQLRAAEDETLGAIPGGEGLEPGDEGLHRLVLFDTVDRLMQLMLIFRIEKAYTFRDFAPALVALEDASAAGAQAGQEDVRARSGVDLVNNQIQQRHHPCPQRLRYFRQ